MRSNEKNQSNDDDSWTGELSPEREHLVDCEVFLFFVVWLLSCCCWHTQEGFNQKIKSFEHAVPKFTLSPAYCHCVWWNRKRVAWSFCWLYVHLVHVYCLSFYPFFSVCLTLSWSYYSQIEWALRRNYSVWLICFVLLFASSIIITISIRSRNTTTTAAAAVSAFAGVFVNKFLRLLAFFYRQFISYNNACLEWKVRFNELYAVHGRV